MSDQSDQFNAAMREKGVIAAPPGGIVDAQGEPAGRPSAPVLELPRDGWGLDDFAREAGMITKTNGVFRRDNVPVTVDHEKGRIETMDADRFRTYLADLAFLFKWKSNGKDRPPERVKVTMTKDTAAGTLKSDQFLEQQRELARVNVIRQPVIRRNGAMVLLPEVYDEETGVLTLPSDVVIREDMPIEEAVAHLRDLYREFMFPDWVDKPIAERMDSVYLSRQVSLMLGFYGSLLVPHTENRQGGFFNANRERSGKGLLAKMVIVPVMGRMKTRTKPKSDEEFLKTLDTTALCASSYLVLDDLPPGNMKSQDLNSFMTTAWWSGRYMGGQREFEVPLQTIVYMTGHNVTLTGDLAGRVLEVKLEMQEADVQRHRIERVISETWLAKTEVRSDICSALWALMRHWDKMGRPKSTATKPGFEAWCELFGGIVEAAGLGDPFVMPETDESPDPEFDDMRALIGHLMSDVTDKMVEVTFAQLVATCQHLNCFSWMVEGKWEKDKDTGEKTFETSPKCNSRMGDLFSKKYGGARFHLADGRVVKFGQRGKNRHRRYVLVVE